MEPDKIQALTARMHEYVSEKEFAGISLLYQEKGFEPVFLSAGYADLEEKRPMARDTIFPSCVHGSTSYHVPSGYSPHSTIARHKSSRPAATQDSTCRIKSPS